MLYWCIVCLVPVPVIAGFREKRGECAAPKYGGPIIKTLADCALFCRKDVKCEGYLYDNVGYCQRMAKMCEDPVDHKFGSYMFYAGKNLKSYLKFIFAKC